MPAQNHELWLAMAALLWSSHAIHWPPGVSSTHCRHLVGCGPFLGGVVEVVLMLVGHDR